MKVKIPDEVLKFFIENGSIIYNDSTDDSTDFVYYPFVIEKSSDSSVVTLHSFDKLPEDVKKRIPDLRGQNTLI